MFENTMNVLASNVTYNEFVTACLAMFLVGSAIFVLAWNSLGKPEASKQNKTVDA